MGNLHVDEAVGSRCKVSAYRWRVWSRPGLLYILKKLHTSSYYNSPSALHRPSHILRPVWPPFDPDLHRWPHPLTIHQFNIIQNARPQVDILLLVDSRQRSCTVYRCAAFGTEEGFR